MLLSRSLRLGFTAGILALLLGGCDDAARQNANLAPVPFQNGEECHVCGMNIGDFAGPKGEAVAPGAVRKFCSTAELLAGGCSRKTSTAARACTCTTWPAATGTTPMTAT